MRCSSMCAKWYGQTCSNAQIAFFKEDNNEDDERLTLTEEKLYIR